MRSLKNLNKYLIFSGNKEFIFKKINKDEFVAYYGVNRILFTYVQKFYFEHYSRNSYEYIKNTEFQSVIKNNCKVSDLWKKYFGN